ncbi:MAG: YlxR family protein [Vallitaleaceae bacterium]|nr:YlxR family protein [Vallitaleaceae bacterium]
MQKKTPLRKCLGCQEMKNKKSLIRIVKNKDDEFFVDLTGKLNGRGAYICHSDACMEKAIKSKGLERSFQCKIPDEVYEQLKRGLKPNE